MIQVENFLSKKTCKYCIDFFEKNIHKTKIFNKRECLDIMDHHNENKIIKKVINKYRHLHPFSKLENIEIVKWMKNEWIGWHTDSEFYHHSTITYLNESFKGGITTVKSYDVEPKTGKIIMFSSNTFHKASQITGGERYIIGAWYINDS